MKLFVIIKISNYRKRKARKNWYSKSERACPRSSNQRGISWSSTLHRDLVDRPWRFTELLHKRPKPSFGVDHMARTFVNVRFDDSLTFDSNEFVTDARITQHVIPSYSHCALKKKKTHETESPRWCIRRWSISNCCQDLCIYVYPRRACCNRGCANLNSVESGVRIKMPKMLVHARPIGASRTTDSRIESSEPRHDNSRGSISLLAQTAKLSTHANLKQSTHTRCFGTAIVTAKGFQVSGPASLDHLPATMNCQ